MIASWHCLPATHSLDAELWPHEHDLHRLKMWPLAVWSLAGGTDVRTRVTRRSQEADEPSERLNTSEFFEQIFDLPDQAQPKASPA